MMEMHKKDYRRGWEDCLDLISYELRRRGLLNDEIKNVLDRIYAAIKEDKIDRLKYELGL